MVAQLRHVVERGDADPGDGLYLCAIVRHQRLEPPGVLGNPFRGGAPEIVELARLGGEKLAGEAELAVDGDQARFEQRRFLRQNARRIAEPCRFPRRTAHGD